jgi:hypothetical protein
MYKITARPAVLCSDSTKDEDRGESCDSLSLECEQEPRLDGPDKSPRFTPLNNFPVSDLGQPISAERNSAIFQFPNDLFKFNSFMNSNF